MATTYTSNGIVFNRSGSCDRCPLYQPAPCCVGCPHLDTTNNTNTCLIYNKRNQVCNSCKTLGKNVDNNGTHADCIDWPQSPFVDAVKRGKCKFSFAIKNQTDKTKYDDLNSRWS